MNATSSYPVDLPVFSDGNFLALDPFLMAFDDPSSQLLPQVSGNIYEDFAAVSPAHSDIHAVADLVVQCCHET